MSLSRVLMALGAVAGALAGGCAGGGTAMSPEQRRELQTRTVDASRDDVLNAAATAVMDEGLLFTVADGEAGLVGASSAVTTNSCAHRANTTTTAFFRTVTVWVRGIGPRRSEVRVVVSGDSTPESVTKVVTAIERRLPGGAAGPISSGVGR